MTRVDHTIGISKLLKITFLTLINYPAIDSVIPRGCDIVYFNKNDVKPEWLKDGMKNILKQ